MLLYIRKREQIQSIKSKQEEPKTDFYDDPEKRVYEILERKEKEQFTYAQDVQRNMVGLVDKKYRTPDGNPTDEGEAVAKELINVAKNFNAAEYKDLSPKRTAELLVAKAEANAFKGFKKDNAFDGRQPTKKPLGASKGSKQEANDSPKPKITSERAQKLAQKWGYSSEDLAKIFPEDG